MRSQSSPLPWVIPCLLLLFLTLRPVAALETLMHRALAPVRKAGELAAPLVLLQRIGGRAAEERLLLEAAEEEAAGARLLQALARGSLPTEPELLRGRRIVHGAVIGRLRGHQDFLRVELRDTRGVLPGYPVACGDAYVGRVSSVQPESALMIVELVTGSDFHVGAVVEEPEWPGGELDDTPVLMTVGGLFAPDRGDLQPKNQISLAVDHPSDRAIEGGLVRVDERYGESAEIRRIQELSRGLVLGELTKYESYWGIRPELDYKDGLFHVVVLCPEDPSLGSDLPFESATQDDQWLRVRPIGLGDPSPYRQTARVRAGSAQGVEPGAAVISLAGRLVARISSSGSLTSDVSYLADPGFHVVAVAEAEGAREPFVLGRLVSLGRQAPGEPIRLLWHVRVSPKPDWVELGQEPPKGRVLAKLYTGSGEAGLPSGFAFGQAWIPVDVSAGDARQIELEVEQGPTELHTLFVRTQPTASERAAPERLD